MKNLSDFVLKNKQKGIPAPVQFRSSFSKLPWLNLLLVRDSVQFISDPLPCHLLHPHVVVAGPGNRPSLQDPPLLLAG